MSRFRIGADLLELTYQLNLKAGSELIRGMTAHNKP